MAYLESLLANLYPFHKGFPCIPPGTHPALFRDGRTRQEEPCYHASSPQRPLESPSQWSLPRARRRWPHPYHFIWGCTMVREWALQFPIGALAPSFPQGSM